MIIIDSRVRQLLVEDALNTFPDECCGFLFGREETERHTPDPRHPRCRQLQSRRQDQSASKYPRSTT
ncbi:Mov34/MPN/PAD-1 family protein [Puia sp. P3]|uniref:Mov34/MPN/PAD-1 family protein n=1 Tax=Puia sp. P3 TaxID=3423952 RepID=UPI003D669A44